MFFSVCPASLQLRFSAAVYIFLSFQHPDYMTASKTWPIIQFQGVLSFELGARFQYIHSICHSHIYLVKMFGCVFFDTKFIRIVKVFFSFNFSFVSFIHSFIQNKWIFDVMASVIAEFCIN